MSAPSPLRGPHRWRWSQPVSLWLVGSILLGFFAVSTAPSPLYALYREAWGFSALTLTLVFAAYAFGLLAALLVLGRLSDHRGRCEVLLLSLVLEIGSTLLFWHAGSVGALVAARLVQGAATGIATSTLGAALLDLDRERGALFNSLAPLVGMAVGAAGAGALAEFAPAPIRLVYEVLLALFSLQTVALLGLPETVSRQPGALASLRPQMALPRRARAPLLALLPASTAQWALGGFYSSLGPTLARSVSGHRSPTLGGAVVATLVLGGALAILAVRGLAPERVLQRGALGLITGIAVTLAAIQGHSIGVFFAGSAIAGLGFGAVFNGALRSLMPLAEAHERAGLMATYYVLSYLAFALPAMLAGVFAGHVGVEDTAMGYGVSLIVMAAAALAIGARRAGAGRA